MTARGYCETDFGCFEIVANAKGIVSVKKIEGEIDAIAVTDSRIMDCSQQLEAYFSGALRTFSLELDWSAHNEFSQKVWNALVKIPYGRTTTYAAIAQKIGHPKAVRAVGLANRNNPIAIIVPCHRVIAKSGKLQGYFYGLEMKQRLLALENPKQFATQTTLF